METDDSWCPYIKHSKSFCILCDPAKDYSDTLWQLFLSDYFTSKSFAEYESGFESRGDPSDYDDDHLDIFSHIRGGVQTDMLRSG